MTILINSGFFLLKTTGFMLEIIDIQGGKFDFKESHINKRQNCGGTCLIFAHIFFCVSSGQSLRSRINNKIFIYL